MIFLINSRARILALQFSPVGNPLAAWLWVHYSSSLGHNVVYRVGTNKDFPAYYPGIRWGPSDQCLAKSLIKQQQHLLLLDSVRYAASGLGQDSGRNQPLLMRKT